MSRNLSSSFWQIKRIRGQSSEERVDNALRLLLEKGEIDGYKFSGELNGKGIDRLVSRGGTKNYKLSVKSSEGGIRHEREDHPRRHRQEDTIFIVPGRSESREDLANRIMSGMCGLEERMHEPHF